MNIPSRKLFPVLQLDNHPSVTIAAKRDVLASITFRDTVDSCLFRSLHIFHLWTPGRFFVRPWAPSGSGEGSEVSPEVISERSSRVTGATERTVGDGLVHLCRCRPCPDHETALWLPGVPGCSRPPLRSRDRPTRPPPSRRAGGADSSAGADGRRKTPASPGLLSKAAKA